MKKDSFTLTLNKTARQTLFGDDQSAFRINIDGAKIGIKAAKSVGQYKDAIPVDSRDCGGLPINIVGTMAQPLAKLFTKYGHTAECPFFVLTKNRGDGGWYSIAHIKDKPKPADLVMKVELPANIDAVVAVATKKVRKTRVTKPKTVVEAKPFSPADDARDYLVKLEHDLGLAGVIVTAAAQEKRVGRPTAELYKAQDMILRFGSMTQRLFGTTHLSEAHNKMKQGMALFSEGLALLNEISQRHENLILLAKELANISQETEIFVETSEQQEPVAETMVEESHQEAAEATETVSDTPEAETVAEASVEASEAIEQPVEIVQRNRGSRRVVIPEAA